MRLDADITTAAVEASRDVTGGDPFTIGVTITRDTDPFEGYEWLVKLPEGIAFGANFQNLSGGVFTICSTPTSVGTPGEIYGGCLKELPETNYVGPVAAFDLRCISTGSFQVELLDLYEQRFSAFSTDLLNRLSEPLPTHTVGITVNCSGVGSTGSTATPAQTP